MPQLNPAPWLLFLVWTWVILTILMPMKVSCYSYPSSPTTQEASKLNPFTPWTWPCQ
uniref:ATP synthase F0 subunit 8 n=1 Tax=Bathytyphlops marionae TaxID=1916735 RepID=UPI0028FCC4B2|nr:ATP synthase F0 subunit 8 [Bathytyphlops marionae]WNH38046.1 ATP synthase F0 subunit 8 [Bathytyphlops marionae]